MRIVYEGSLTNKQKGLNTKLNYDIINILCYFVERYRSFYCMYFFLLNHYFHFYKIS